MFVNLYEPVLASGHFYKWPFFCLAVAFCRVVAGADADPAFCFPDVRRACLGVCPAFSLAGSRGKDGEAAGEKDGGEDMGRPASRGAQISLLGKTDASLEKKM